MTGKTKIALALALLLSCLPFAALAAPPGIGIEHGLTAEQLKETGLDSLSPAQLAALNRLLGEKSAEATQAASVEASRRDGKQGGDWLVGFDDKPVKARLKGSVAGWTPGTVFELENGQQWKVLKGSMKLPKVMESPEVVLIPGIAGRWFLQFDEDQPKARVYLLN
jgi:hypothetical protein